jgi:hypothetical protein
MNYRLICFIVLSITAMSGWLRAEESAPAQPTATTKAVESNAAEKAAAAITKLDAEDFSIREAASQELLTLGTEALPALEQVVRTGSVEAASRAYQIIVKHFEANGVGRLPARDTLQRLAKEESAVGRRSLELLNPPPKPTNEMQPNSITFFGGPGVIRMGGGVIRVVPGVPVMPRAAVPLDLGGAAKRGGIARSLSVSFGIDTKSVELREGDHTHIKIQENADKTITGEITKTKDGKATTDKIAVKDVAELKTKFPEAFELYETHLLKKEKPGGGELGKDVKREKVNGLLELFEKREGLFLKDVERERLERAEDPFK